MTGELKYSLNDLTSECGVSWHTAKKAFTVSVREGWLVAGEYREGAAHHIRFTSTGFSLMCRVIREGAYQTIVEYRIRGFNK